MDDLGHFELEEFKADTATVSGVTQVVIERQGANSFTVALWRPGRDNVIFTFDSSTPAGLLMSHFYEVKRDHDLVDARFEILPHDEGGFYVVDHWRDDPYPVFDEYSDAEMFVQATGGK